MARYINYDKEGILETILNNIKSELDEIYYKLPITLKRVNKLTRTLKETKNENKSDYQIEKMQSDLEKARSEFDKMKQDVTFYDEAQKELERKFFILQELDAEEP